MTLCSFSATIRCVNELETRHHHWVPAVVFGSGLVLLGVTVIAMYYFVLPQSIKAVSVADGAEITLDQPIVVRFDRPINRKKLQPVIEPAVAGTWEFDDMLIGRHFAQSVRFIPDTIYQPGTEYQVSIGGITNIMQTDGGHSFTTSFTAAPLPAVVSVSPSDTAADVTTKATIVFSLDRSSGDFVDWRFVSDPVFDFDQKIDGSVITITPTSALTQGGSYDWRLERTLKARSRSSGDVVEQHTPERVAKGNFKVIPPPSIASLSPTGDHAHIDTPIVVTFSRPMQQESVISRLTVKPSFTYTANWNEDNTVLTVTPTQALTFASDYVVSIGAGAQDTRDGFLSEKVDIPFTTIGPVQVVAISPTGSGVALGSAIRVDFDQAVDEGSARGHFLIQPDVAGSYSWDGLTMVFTPDAAWPYDTTYTVTLAEGIGSVAGQSSTQTYVSSFSTQPQTTMLGISIDYQDRPLSCEAAALKMALAYKGVAVSESAIMGYVGYNTLSARQGNVWGDPYLGFVGDIDGKQNTTGYGVYWDPIATAANHWRPSEVFTDWSTAQILTEIAAGNPVVLWGVYPGGYYDPWQTAEGKTIDAWKGEHARTIIGFVGTTDEPEQIIINDPIAGRLYWSRSTFESNAATFHFSGVVVR